METVIKNRAGVVLFAQEINDSNPIKLALEAAVASDISLREADLRGADLGGANLCVADLGGADLCGADLHGASLLGAGLIEANLHGANLHGANLHGANLHGADLREADLREADLRGAELREADLRGAYLRGADLSGINLSYSIVPEEGAFIGWKKLRENVIAKLEIPANAARTSTPIGRKNRAEFVRVLELIGADEGISLQDKNVKYRVGEIVRADSYNPDIRLECTNGIHFFITRAEAEAY